MLKELTYLLIQAWEQEVAEAYRSGRLIHELALAAEFYRHLQGEGIPPAEVWVQPVLHFLPPNQKAHVDEPQLFTLSRWLERQTVGLLVGQNEVVTAAIELQVSPDRFSNYDKAVRRLVYLSRLGGKDRLLLRPERKGEPAVELAPDLLCVFATITKTAGFALDRHALQTAYRPGEFPAHFLHLTAAVKQGEATFRHSV
jgi:hypothetical protein